MERRIDELEIYEAHGQRDLVPHTMNWQQNSTLGVQCSTVGVLLEQVNSNQTTNKIPPFNLHRFA